MIDNLVAAMFWERPNPKETAITAPWPKERDCRSRRKAARKEPAQVAAFLLEEMVFTLGWVEREHPGQLEALGTWLGALLGERLGLELRLSPIRVLDCLIWWDGNDQPTPSGGPEPLFATWTGSEASYSATEVRAFVARLLAAGEPAASAGSAVRRAPEKLGVV